MINTRDVHALVPRVRNKCKAFLLHCTSQGLDVIVTSTFRDHAAQAELYARGRTAPGRIVTWAGPGESFHNYGVAFDVVPLRLGKCVWGTSGDGIDNDPTDDDTDDLELWQRLGAIGEECGLEWAGHWPRRKREFPHFQDPNGYALADYQAGRVPTET